MKKDNITLITIIIICLSLIIYYSFQINKSEIFVDDYKESEYVAFEIKRSKIESAIRLIEEQKYDEALIVLERYKENNPFLFFYKGFVLYQMDKKIDGLNLIKLALQSSPVLYDTKYKNNIRLHIENILNQIRKEENLKDFRHFFESKLKGGCG